MSGEAVPFQRANLREQIKDVILQRIVSQAYPPGSRLVETRIAQELGVSQAPVREALRDLEQLGCVVHEPFRGCSVRALSADDLLEAFPVRAALESLACRLAAEQITERELEQLEARIEDMRAAYAREDPHAQSQADARFHATVVRATRNGTLERQWSLLEPFLRTYISVAHGADLRTLPDRHVPILDALRARDAEAAAAAMHRHLMDAAEALRSGTAPDTKETP
jgi:DNA-binding GntR family transcriptional regulator